MLSCYRVIVLSLLHEGVPKQNHHEPHPKAINLTPKRLGSSTRQARPRMKGVQSDADGATACKTTWRSLKHRNGEQHLCIFCRPIQTTSPTTYCRSQALVCVCHRMPRDCTERVTRYGLKSGEKKKPAMTLPRERALSKTIRGACGLCATGCQEIALSA